MQREKKKNFGIMKMYRITQLECRMFRCGKFSEIKTRRERESFSSASIEINLKLKAPRKTSSEIGNNDSCPARNQIGSLFVLFSDRLTHNAKCKLKLYMQNHVMMISYGAP